MSRFLTKPTVCYPQRSLKIYQICRERLYKTETNHLHTLLVEKVGILTNHGLLIRCVCPCSILPAPSQKRI